MKHIDWYFDFVSPFAYLQSTRLADLARQATLTPRPLLFAGLLQHWGQLGPAELPPKRVWTFEHCAWLAHRDGIAFSLPAAHPFNPLPLLRLAVALDEDGRLSVDCLQRLFRFVWQEGHLPSEAVHWRALLDECGVAEDRLGSATVRQRLYDHGTTALAQGVFGVPTAICAGRLFWGFDATDMLLAWLADEPFFQSAAFAAAGALPEGQQRPRGAAS